MKPLLGALLALAFSTPAAAASLIGTTATATLLFPNMSTPYAGPVSAVVGPSVEFAPGAFAPASGSIDIGANTIQYFANASATYTPASFNGYQIDFGGLPISSFTVDPSSTFVPQSATFSGSSVFFNVSGQSVQDGQFTLFNVDAVPEPGTWAMMLAGFGLMGVSIRRRRTYTLKQIV